MKNTFYLMLGLCLIPYISTAQKNMDKNSIKSMTGCYEVTFNYAETFSPDSNYQFHKREKSKGLEYISVIEDSDNKISLQHLLIANVNNEPFIIKHWRQDWVYENTDFYLFDKDNQWKFTSLPKDKVRKQWTQQVFQVDDSPRYSGSSTWVHTDGKNYWENTSDAPLPRREYTQRSDYNVLKRTNRHEITNYGWIHIQDNDKVLREAGKKDKIIAQERGENMYVKTDDKRCLPAEQWWKTHTPLWSKVRNSWNKIYKRNKDLIMVNQKKDTELFEILSDFENNTSQQDIDTAINQFIN